MLPHRICLNFNTLLMLMLVMGDAVIALSYVAISAVLFYITYKIRFRFRGFILSFALFILLCGITHVMNVVVLWSPVYWIEAGVLAGTAFVSAVTALTLIKAREAIYMFIIGRHP